MRIRSFHPADTESVVQLWEDCGLTRPWNDPHQDIARKQTVQPELFLVGCEGEQIIATVMAGYDGHRGWINYLAVAPSHRRQGIGRRLMTHVEQRLVAAGCPKINLQIRATNQQVADFYSAIGYRVDDVISMGKRLIPDEPADSQAQANA